VVETTDKTVATTAETTDKTVNKEEEKDAQALLLRNKALNPESGIAHIAPKDKDIKFAFTTLGSSSGTSVVSKYGINYIVLTPENVQAILGKDKESYDAWQAAGLSTRYKLGTQNPDGVQAIAYLTDNTAAATNERGAGNRAVSGIITLKGGERIKFYGNMVSAQGLIRYNKNIKGFNFFDGTFTLKEILKGPLKDPLKVGLNYEKLEVNRDGVYKSFEGETNPKAYEKARVKFIEALKQSIIARIEEAKQVAKTTPVVKDVVVTPATNSSVTPNTNSTPVVKESVKGEVAPTTDPDMMVEEVAKEVTPTEVTPTTTLSDGLEVVGEGGVTVSLDETDPSYYTAPNPDGSTDIEDTGDNDTKREEVGIPAAMEEALNNMPEEDSITALVALIDRMKAARAIAPETVDGIEIDSIQKAEEADTPKKKLPKKLPTESVRIADKIKFFFNYMATGMFNKDMRNLSEPRLVEGLLFNEKKESLSSFTAEDGTVTDISKAFGNSFVVFKGQNYILKYEAQTAQANDYRTWSLVHMDGKFLNKKERQETSLRGSKDMIQFHYMEGVVDGKQEKITIKAIPRYTPEEKAAFVKKVLKNETTTFDEEVLIKTARYLNKKFSVALKIWASKSSPNIAEHRDKIEYEIDAMSANARSATATGEGSVYEVIQTFIQNLVIGTFASKRSRGTIRDKTVQTNKDYVWNVENNPTPNGVLLNLGGPRLTKYYPINKVLSQEEIAAGKQRGNDLLALYPLTNPDNKDKISNALEFANTNGEVYIFSGATINYKYTKVGWKSGEEGMTGAEFARYYEELKDSVQGYTDNNIGVGEGTEEEVKEVMDDLDEWEKARLELEEDFKEALDNVLAALHLGRKGTVKYKKAEAKLKEAEAELEEVKAKLEASDIKKTFIREQINQLRPDDNEEALASVQADINEQELQLKSLRKNSPEYIAERKRLSESEHSWLVTLRGKMQENIKEEAKIAAGKMAGRVVAPFSSATDNNPIFVGFDSSGKPSFDENEYGFSLSVAEKWLESNNGKYGYLYATNSAFDRLIDRQQGNEVEGDIRGEQLNRLSLVPIDYIIDFVADFPKILGYDSSLRFSRAVENLGSVNQTSKRGANLRLLLQNIFDNQDTGFDDFFSFRESVMEQILRKSSAAREQSDSLKTEALYELYFLANQTEIDKVANDIYLRDLQRSENAEAQVQAYIEGTEEGSSIEEQRAKRDIADWIKSQFAFDIVKFGAQGKIPSFALIADTYPKEWYDSKRTKSETYQDGEKLQMSDFDVFNSPIKTSTEKDGGETNTPAERFAIEIKASKKFDPLRALDLIFSPYFHKTEFIVNGRYNEQIDTLKKISRRIQGLNNKLVVEVDERTEIRTLGGKMEKNENFGKSKVFIFGDSNYKYLTLSEEQREAITNAEDYIIYNSIVGGKISWLRAEVAINIVAIPRAAKKVDFQDPKWKNYEDSRPKDLISEISLRIQHVLNISSENKREFIAIFEDKIKKIKETNQNYEGTAERLLEMYIQDLVDKYVVQLAKMYQLTGQYRKSAELTTLYGTTQLDIYKAINADQIVPLTKEERDANLAAAFGNQDGAETEGGNIVDPKSWENLEDQNIGREGINEDIEARKTLIKILTELVPGYGAYRRWIRANLLNPNPVAPPKIKETSLLLDAAYEQAKEKNFDAEVEGNQRKKIKAGLIETFNLGNREALTEEKTAILNILTDLEYAKQKSEAIESDRILNDKQKEALKYQLKNDYQGNRRTQYKEFEDFATRALKSFGVTNPEHILEFTISLMEKRNAFGSFSSKTNKIILNSFTATGSTITHEFGHFVFDKLPVEAKRRLYEEILVIARTKGLHFGNKFIKFGPNASVAEVTKQINQNFNSKLTVENALEEAIMYQIQQPLADALTVKGDVKLYNKAKAMISKFWQFLKGIFKRQSFLQEFKNDILLGIARKARKVEATADSTFSNILYQNYNSVGPTGDFDVLKISSAIQPLIDGRHINEPLVTYKVSDTQTPSVRQIERNSFVVEYNPKLTGKKKITEENIVSVIVDSTLWKAVDFAITRYRSERQLAQVFSRPAQGRANNPEDNERDQITASIMQRKNLLTSKELQPLVKGILSGGILIGNDQNNTELTSTNYNTYYAGTIPTELIDKTEAERITYYSNQFKEIATNPEVALSDRLGQTSFLLNQLSLTDGPMGTSPNNVQRVNEMSQLIVAGFNTFSPDSKSSYSFDKDGKKVLLSDIEAFEMKIQELVISRSKFVKSKKEVLILSDESSGIYANLSRFLALTGTIGKETGALSKPYFQVLEGLLLTKKELEIVIKTDNPIFVAGQGGDITQNQKDEKGLAQLVSLFSINTKAIATISSNGGLEEFLHLTEESLLATKKEKGAKLTELETQTVKKISNALAKTLLSRNQSVYSDIAISDSVTRLNNKKGFISKAGAIGKTLFAPLTFYSQMLIIDASLLLEKMDKRQLDLTTDTFRGRGLGSFFSFGLKKDEKLTQKLLDKLFDPDRISYNTGSVYNALAHYEDNVEGFQSFVQNYVLELAKSGDYNTAIEKELIYSFLTPNTDSGGLTGLKARVGLNKFQVSENTQQIFEAQNTSLNDFKDKLLDIKNRYTVDLAKQVDPVFLNNRLKIELDAFFVGDDGDEVYGPFITALKAVSTAAFNTSAGEPRFKPKQLRLLLETIDRDYQKLVKNINVQTERAYNVASEDRQESRETNSPYSISNKFISKAKLGKLGFKANQDATFTERDEGLARHLLKSPVSYDLKEFRTQFESEDSILLQNFQSKTTIYKNNQNPIVYLSQSVNNLYQQKLAEQKQIDAGRKPPNAPAGDSKIEEVFRTSSLGVLKTYLDFYAQKIQLTRDLSEDLRNRDFKNELQNATLRIITGALYVNFQLAMISSNILFMQVGTALYTKSPKLAVKIAYRFFERIVSGFKDSITKNNSNLARIEATFENLIAKVAQDIKNNNGTNEHLLKTVKELQGLKVAALGLISDKYKTVKKASNTGVVNALLLEQIADERLLAGPKVAIKALTSVLQTAINTLVNEVNTTAETAILLDSVTNYVNSIDFRNPNNVDSLSAVTAWTTILNKLEFINSLSDQNYSGVEKGLAMDRGLFSKTPLRIVANGYLKMDLFGVKSVALAAVRKYRKDTLTYPDLTKGLVKYGLQSTDPRTGYAEKARSKILESSAQILSAGVISLVSRLIISFIKGDDDDKERMLGILEDLAGRDFGRGFARLIGIGLESSAIVYAGVGKAVTGTTETFKFLSDLVANVSRLGSKFKPEGEQESVFGAGRELLQLVLAAFPEKTAFFGYKAISALIANNSENSAEKALREQEDQNIKPLSHLEMIFAAFFYSTDNVVNYKGVVQDSNDDFKTKPEGNSTAERVLRDLIGVKDRNEKGAKKTDELLDDNNAVNRKSETFIEGKVKDILEILTGASKKPESSISPENRLPDKFPAGLKTATEKMIQEGTLTRDQAIDLGNKNVLSEKKLTAVDEYVGYNNSLNKAKLEGDQAKIKQYEKALEKLAQRDKDYQKKIDYISEMGYPDFAKTFGEKQLQYQYDDRQNKFKISEAKKQDTADSLQTKARNELFDIGSLAGRQGGGKGGGGSRGGGKLGNRFSSPKMKALKPSKIVKAKAIKGKKATIKRVAAPKSVRYSSTIKQSSNKSARVSSPKFKSLTLKLPKIKALKMPTIKLSTKFKTPKLSL
jgi:hypothetical protein